MQKKIFATKVKKVNANNQLIKKSLGREYAFKFLYKHLMPEFEQEKNELKNNSNKLDHALSVFDLSFSEHDDEHPNNKLDHYAKNFAKELIQEALIEESTSLINIEEFVQKNIDKVDKLNLSVLLIGIAEMKKNPTMGAGIFINEYVNIAKKYCPNESAGFINSILDRVHKKYAK